MFLGETEKIKCCKSPVRDARKVYRINNLLFGSRLHILVLVAVAERKNTTLELYENICKNKTQYSKNVTMIKYD